MPFIFVPIQIWKAKQKKKTKKNRGIKNVINGSLNIENCCTSHADIVWIENPEAVIETETNEKKAWSLTTTFDNVDMGNSE